MAATLDRLKSEFKDKEVISTLDCEGLTYNRRDGNSTRQVDFAIQELYKGKVVVIEDHHEEGDNQRVNQSLFDRVLRRLKNEHNLDQLLKEKKLGISDRGAIIYLRLI